MVNYEKQEMIERKQIISLFDSEYIRFRELLKEIAELGKTHKYPSERRISEWGKIAYNIGRSLPELKD